MSSGAATSVCDIATLLPTTVMAAMPASRVLGAAAGAVFMSSACDHNGLVGRSKESPGDWSITSGADFLQLNAGDAPAGGLSDWLAGQLRLAIADGRLPVG